MVKPGHPALDPVMHLGLDQIRPVEAAQGKSPMSRLPFARSPAIGLAGAESRAIDDSVGQQPRSAPGRAAEYRVCGK